MKDINDICVVVQARMGSQRIPGKMLRAFTDTTLIDILFNKLSKSTILPKPNIYFSVYENELKEVGEKHGINIFHRSKDSAYAETDMKLIYEWHNKLPYKYIILISACNPLLTIETIDQFLKSFIESDKEGAFAVFEKKTYYWNQYNEPITDWKGASIMNTKLVEPIYEAAHCLYASRLDIIEKGYWMDTNYPPKPELFIMKELEAFDIDYEWQFQLGEQLYKMNLC
jgi:CMP-N-acetylneuraminic acid synthetase